MILEITLKNQISPFLQLSSKLSSKIFLFSTTKCTCRYPTLLQNTKFDLLVLHSRFAAVNRIQCAVVAN